MLKPRHPCFCLDARLYLEINIGAPRGFGELGRRAIYFRELGRTGNYFRDLRSKLIVFLGFGEPCKKVKNKFMNSYLKEKPSFHLIFFLVLRLLRGSPITPTPWKI